MHNKIQKIKNQAIKSQEKSFAFNKELIDLHSKSGQEYFDGLVQYLCNKTNAKFSFVAKYITDKHLSSTQSFYANNTHVANFKYSLSNTPCETIINNNLEVYPKNVQQIFPLDEDLKKFGIESYIGIPLYDVSQNPEGLIVIMDDKPIENIELFKGLLLIVKHKTELEIERTFLKKQRVLSHKEFIKNFENFQDVFFQDKIDSKDNIVDFIISPSAEKMFGYKQGNKTKFNFIDLYANIDDRTILLKKLKKEKHIKNYPLKFKKEDGTIIHVEIDAELINKKIASNGTFSIRGVIKDVTKKYKENLRLEIAYLIAQKSQRRLTNINLLSEYIYHTLKNIMNVSNFYIALHDVDKNELNMPIFIDKKTSYSEDRRKIPYKNGLTEYIIESKKILHKNKKVLKELITKEGIHVRGELSECFVGVPLKSEGMCFGAMVMQSYKKDDRFTTDDVDLLTFIASQFAYIIERTQWQEAIVKKEEHYRSLVENSSEIIGIINDEGLIEYISESSKRIVGYCPSELIGENISTFIKQNISSSVFNKILDTPSVHKLRIYDKNNNKKYLEFSLAKKKGSKKEIIFNAKDITNAVIANKKKKIAQRKLKKRNDDLTDVFNYSNEGIVKTNNEGKFLFVNKRLCKILGYTEKELLEKDYKSITYNDDLKRSTALFEKIKKEKITDISLDKKYVHKNGTIVDCHVTIKWTFNENEKNDTSFAFIADKTNERNAFKQVNNLKKALDISACVFLTDVNSLILDANVKSCEISGYTREELIGKPMSIFNSNYYSDKEWKEFWTILKSGKIWQNELRNQAKNGSYYWVFATVIPILNTKNEIHQYLSIQFDITEEKKSKSNTIKEVIEAQEHERERFAMEIHDGLGQILLASKMNLNALQDSSEGLSDDSKEILNTSIDLLNDAVHEARNISHGLMSRVLKLFGLSHAIEDVVENINKTTDLDFTFTHNIKDVRFDEEIEMGVYRTLQELTKNIITHAKATTVTLDITKIKNQLAIIIKDDGIGISKGKINKPKSNGIGLKNMKSRVEYLGGTFKIDNTIKKGTKINIIISL